MNEPLTNEDIEDINDDTIYYILGLCALFCALVAYIAIFYV